MKQRLTVLVLLLLASVLSTFIKFYFTHSDCESQQKQIQECISTQATILKQNHDILDKDKELTEDIIKLREMVSNMSADTVYVEKTKIEKHFLKTENYYSKVNYDTSDKVMYMTESESIPLPEKSVSETKKTKFKSGNSKSILSQMDKIIQKTKK